ncbi:hypothetical protein OUZ56_007925 [Daphnia magna]|uniref:Uncharacterized protein n=1 Tax=Daphnia magna TaxID=35525 RepID=A0ABR0ABM3_9CRUS|nr:hypothetical protein OUZ56_007925 [Daphnia magna]
MGTANYLRPLDEIICLSKRQINTKPNYPAKGSALFASCARPFRLYILSVIEKQKQKMATLLRLLIRHDLLHIKAYILA